MKVANIAYILAALVILQAITVFAFGAQSIGAYRAGYDAAIKSAELIDMDGSGYVLRFGKGDDFQVHEYAFEEVS